MKEVKETLCADIIRLKIYLNLIIAQSHGVSDGSFFGGGGVRVTVVFVTGCGVHHRDFIVRLIFSFSRSIAKTRTFTDCPR